MENKNSPWLALEAISGLAAVASVWRTFLGLHFESFQQAFFQIMPEPAAAFWCPRCCSAHEVVLGFPRSASRAAGSLFSETAVGRPRVDPSQPPISAVGTRDDIFCPPIELSPADIQMWSLSWPRLARALCHAFALESKFTRLELYQTCQIGAWSADSIPVILTIQAESEHLAAVISRLALGLRQKFILLGPTNDKLNVPCQEALANAGAAFFPLDSTVA